MSLVGEHLRQQIAQSNVSIKHTGTQANLNATIFDGANEKLREDMDVLVEGNKITTIKFSIPVLMPGLIDVHWFPCLQQFHRPNFCNPI
jgi:imidazolonepropionase-like amidohydrolase